MKAYRFIAWLAVILALIVIMVGAYTRLSDAGLGCPDWPGCYGHLTVPHSLLSLQNVAVNFPGQIVQTAKAWTEMTHRYIAGILGLLIFILALWGLVQRRLIQVHPLLLIALMLVVVFQAFLGMWTVTLKLMPIVVMGHLLGGFTTLSLLGWTLLKSQRAFSSLQPEPALTALRPWAIIAVVITALQIALGGWTSSNYAALSCQSLPFCHSNSRMTWDFANAFQWWTPFDQLSAAAKMTIQMVHRMGAIIVALYIGGLALRIFTQTQQKIWRRLAIILLAILVLQILLGFLNVLFSLPLAIAVLHNGCAAVLLLTVLTINYALANEKSYASQ